MISVDFRVRVSHCYFVAKREILCVTHCLCVCTSVQPKIIQEPVNPQVLKSYTSYLTCVTSGTPPARVDWSKLSSGFKPVSMDQPRFEKMLNGTLVIRNTTDEDRGKYLCTARNGVSDKSVSRSVQLTVHGMERFAFEICAPNFL